MLRTMQHHTTSRYLKHNSIVAARRTPWALVRQCRQHSCDIGQVTLYPISGGWVLPELTTGDGNNENAFANHVASVRGSPTCEACPRMEFLQEPRVFARISSLSFQRLPMAAPRQAMTRRHVRDARSTRGRRRRSNVLTKSTFTVFIGLACSRETPFGSVRSGSSDGELEL